jgi:hypothetical protein
MSQPLRQGQPADAFLTAQRLTEVAQPIDPVELDLLFNCFCQFPSFFAEARRIVQEYHFDPTAELQYALMWRSMCAIADRHGHPNNDTLIAEVMQHLKPLQQTLPPDFVDGLLRQDGHGLIWASTFTPPSETTLAYGREKLRKFLHERTVVYPLRRMLSQGLAGTYSVELPKLLDLVNVQRGAIDSLQAVPRVLCRPPGAPIDRPAQIFRSTGIGFFDRILGGQRVGDLNGFIGAIGAGKTTTGCHMATASAKQAYTEWEAAGVPNTRPDLTLFITAEESGDRVMPRLQSAAFQIPRVKLETMTDWSALTHPGATEAYEQALAPTAPEVLSEMDRYYINYEWFNSSLEVFDMSGSQQFPHAGEGFVPEIVANIESTLNARGQRLRTVIIDWVGILVERYMGANGIRQDNLRYYISKFLSDCRRMVAERFGCTVWAMHQLKTSLGSSSPTKLFHHSDAAEATNYAAELAVCACMGVPDNETGCRRINFSKVRYKPNEEVQPVIVKIHRMFSLLEDVGHLYGVDDSGHKFALLSDLTRVQGSPTAQVRPASNGPPGMRRTDPIDDLGIQN